MTAEIDTTYTAIADAFANDLPVSPGYLLQKVRSAARQFFMDSEVWQENSQPIDIVSGQQIYPIDVQRNAVVKSVFSVWRGDPASVFLPPEDLAHYRLVDLNKIELLDECTKSVSDGMIVRVSLFPNMASYDTPVNMVERWSEAIQAAVKADLFSDVNKPWSNPRAALSFASQYRTKVAEAIVQWHTNGNVKRTALKGCTIV